MKKIAILGIDLQNDFTLPTGSLYVAGADEDVKRIVTFIETISEKLDYIGLTLDSHQPIHIAHQSYWKNEKGEHPETFSTVTYDEVKSGKWIPQFNANSALGYLKELEEKGDVCTIWPLHCILGTEGWAINRELMDCLIKWTVENDKSYELFYKGYAQNTEHYSMFRAAVEYEKQSETQLNTHLLKLFNAYDELIIVGEAADFCVASSLNDILKENQKLAEKVILFTDCMSWIVEGNPKAKSIFEEAKEMNVRFMKSTDYLS